VSAAAGDDALVLELARATVQRAAPEELPLFGPVSEAYLEDPAQLERDGGGDRMLGFGAEAAMLLITPAALQIARDVFNFVAAQVRSRLRDEGEGAIQGTLDRIFGKRGADAAAAPEPKPPELSDEELVRVRAVALEKAKLLKLPEAKAELLADSLVGSLATG
jgi:hypothetical protein